MARTRLPKSATVRDVQMHPRREDFAENTERNSNAAMTDALTMREREKVGSVRGMAANVKLMMF